MKSMILAAGFGTRLLPFTKNIPKPLFTIAGHPVLEIIIRNLQHAGFSDIMINTHHLHREIESFISKQPYAGSIHILYEPLIRGTGGAIQNISDCWKGESLMVINGDIVTDIDLRGVYQFHREHPHPATLVLQHDPEFDHVSIDKDGFITAFNEQWEENRPKPHDRLAFTGIQVIDREVIDFIPNRPFSDIIDAYKKMLSQGLKLRAFVPTNCYWKDIGTPKRFKEAVFEKMAPQSFQEAFSDARDHRIIKTALNGDGSDRKWYRLTQKHRSLIMVDHGIKEKSGTSEVEAFIAIGHHLYQKGLPVPQIYLHDAFSGLIFLEDLGDIHLQKRVRDAKRMKEIIRCYQSVIDGLISLSITGAEGFDPNWTYQTPAYDKQVILENECRYFVEAFLNRYLKWHTPFDDLKDEFLLLAEKALTGALIGFMHRDMQSKNIMFNNSNPYFIDFQGGRIGPIQYDLASLLIDPYVNLPRFVQDALLDYAIEKLSSSFSIEKESFRRCFNFCAVSRNLQILGAFGFLTCVKKKTGFAQYIPAAIKMLNHRLQRMGDDGFSRLTSVVEKIQHGGTK